MTGEEKIVKIIESISAQLLNLKMERLSSLKGLELSASYFQYVSVIHRLRQTTVTDLAEKLKISKPAVTVFIDKLLKQKVVVKTQSEDDRRFFYIKLSKKGEQIAEVYNDTMLSFAKNVKDAMSEGEFRQLITLLEKCSV